MTDRELLELAAKVYGGSLTLCRSGVWVESYNDGGNARPWNPLTDDGDALRLAVTLGLDINPYPATQEVAAVKWSANSEVKHKIFEKWNDDPQKATRRVIVRAAAAIGKSMP